ncbi:unnamed protein product, partial [Hymenolepis diminuta]
FSSALLLTSPVCTVPSFSYNRPDQLKHAYNYILMRVLIQVTIINSLPLHTYTGAPSSSDASPFAQSFSSNSLFSLETLY